MYLLRSYMQKVQELIYFYFYFYNLGGELVLLRGQFWVKNGSVLGVCRDGFGSHLRWEKWESIHRFRKLGVSNFNNL